MEKMKTVYYLIHGSVVARRDREGDCSRDYLFREGKWVDDADHVIMDHLMGYDPTEPEGSPYRFGSTSVLMEMDEIPYEEAARLINQQIPDALKKK